MKISNLIKTLSAVSIGFLLIAGLAIAKPAANSKPTVVVVYSHSCPMCNEFDNRVLSNPEVKKALAKFVLKKVDANSTRINVEVTPTVIIYDKNHKLIRKFVPSLEQGKFIEILNQVDSKQGDSKQGDSKKVDSK